MLLSLLCTAFRVIAYLFRLWKAYFVFCIMSIPMGIDYVLHVQKFNRKRLEQVLKDERDIKGKVAIVTGSNAGIGYETAKGLAQCGATVIMACRDTEKATKASQSIMTTVPDAKLEILPLDLSDLDSIRLFSSEVHRSFNHVDILINNGGVQVEELTATKHGFETNMGINYLGHFLLTLLLLDLLLAADKARIIGVTSTLLTVAQFDPDNLMMDHKIIPPLTLYANSKFAIATFMKSLGDLLQGTSVSTYAVCTGICDTQMARSALEKWSRHAAIFTKFGLFTAEQGSQSVLYCALSKALATESGQTYRFLSHWNYANWLLNYKSNEFRSKLWKISEDLVGLQGFYEQLLQDLKNK